MYAQDKAVIIVGYPKSGNTYLARLMGSLLDSPVVGYKNGLPLAAEGSSRPGEYFITQLHLKPTIMPDEDEAIPDIGHFNTCCWNGERIIHIVRDPRDVAVSVVHYWELKSIHDTIEVMGKGTFPLSMHGPWSEFVDSWLREFTLRLESDNYTVLFEDLIKDPAKTTGLILDWMSLPHPGDERIAKAIECQSFDNKIREIERDGDTRPWGKATQLKNLRKGIVGDWKNYFSRADNRLAQKYFGDTMSILGYNLLT
jgi:hypothetical protein